MAPEIKGSLDRLIRSLASLRLAVVVLGLLAAVLAAATIYESKFGIQAAQHDIYQAGWFSLLLLLLAVNVAAATFIRLPWRLKQIGFLITHLAILLILGGCLTTHWLGVTGRLTLSEGKQDNKIQQDGWAIRVTGHGVGSRGDSVEIPISDPPSLGGAVRFDLGGQSYTMKVLEYLPNAQIQEELVEGAPTDPVGILVELAQPRSAMQKDDLTEHSSQQWLLLDDKGRWAVNTPGFSMAAVSKYTPPVESPVTGPSRGTLVATIEGKEYEADVERAMAEPVTLADGKATLHVTGYYEHATVGMGGKMDDDPARPVNPALIVELTADGKKQRRVIFAKFGDISAMHGGGKEQTVKLALRHTQSGQGGMNVVLVPNQDKWALYEENGSKLLQQADLQQDSPVVLKTMPVSLAVRKILPHAKARKRMVPKTLPKGMDPQPAVDVEISGADGQTRQWLAWSQQEMFVIGAKAVRLNFGPQAVGLPFAVQLDKFEVEHYSGSSMPAMYRSEVTVIDTASREKRSVTIEMNKPLEYKGWSFFQSGFSSNDRENISILSVSKDPGQPFVYCGAFLLVLGTVILAIQRLKTQVPVAGKNAAEPNSAAGTGSKRTVVAGSDHA